MIRQTLVVCEGNVCRSPAAEVLLRHAVPGLLVASAGLAAPEGRAAHPSMQALCSGLGLSLAQHRSRQLTPLWVREAELILVMQGAHQQQILQAHPGARGRVHRLLPATDIPDPLGQTEAYFQQVFAQLQRGVSHWRALLQAVGQAPARP